MPALIAVASGMAYSSSFAGAFLFDDIPHIVANRNLHHLWPVGAVVGETLRPLLFYSLALNYAVSGLAPWSYHLVNLLIHLAAALALFGIVRRTLSLPLMKSQHHVADDIALAVALIWVVHPLNTQAVTYVVQRSESMAAMFYLLSLYAFLRAAAPAGTGWWYGVSLAALGAGLGSKEIVVTAPLLFLLFDRCFVSGTFRTALHRRWRLYGAIAAALPLVFLVRWVVGLPNTYVFVYVWAGITGQRAIALPGSFAFAPLQAGQLSGFAYLMSQPAAILRYLRLALWPCPLVLDYRWPPATGWRDVALPSLLVAVLLVVTLWALRRAPVVGFLAACFFLLLVPSSSMLPLPDVIVEHRMYLPLAALVSLFVAGVVALDRRARRAGWFPRLPPAASLAIVVAVLASLTFARNFDYESGERMWADVVSKAPDNARAHYNLGTLLAERGRLAAATELFEEAIRRDPSYVPPHVNLGMALYVQGRFAAAEQHYEAALSLQPFAPSAHNNMGTLRASQGRWREARFHFEQVIREIHRHAESAFLRMPLLARAHTNLGTVWLEQDNLLAARRSFERALHNDPELVAAHLAVGRLEQMAGEPGAALAAYRGALRLDPHNPLALHGTGDALLLLRRPDEAHDAYLRAVRGAPANAAFRHDLGRALVAVGDVRQAATRYGEAIALDPRFPDAYNSLGLLRAANGDPEGAVVAFRQALAVDSGFAAAHDNIGTTLIDQGRTQQAVDAYLQALFVDPDFARAHNNLAVALWQQGALDDAVAHLREALRIQSDYPQAQENLNKILRLR